MQRLQRDGIAWLEFELLRDADRLSHGVFLRQGGVSEGPYRSLNLSPDVGDDPAHVAENHRRVAGILGVDDVVQARQTHGIRHHLATADGVRVVEDCDALMTATAGLALMIKTADCQAAIVYDPIRHVVANVHSGWRGNVQNIYQRTVEAMRAQWGSQPADLLVGISPSLGPTAAEFIHHETEFPPNFRAFETSHNHFDLWALARMQLEEAGVLAHHIEVAGLCTRESEQDCFSYRRERVCGRHGTFVALR